MKRIAGIAAALVVLAAATAQAQTAAPDARNKPVAPFKIIGDLYYVGTEGLSSFLVKSPQGNALIDTGLADTAPLIEDSITRLGVKLSDIKYILISRAAPESAGGLARLRKDTGAQVLAGAADKPAIEAGFAGVAAVKVDRAVADNDTLNLVDAKVTKGGVLFVAHAMPGPTPGCTSWTLPIRDQKWNHTAMFFCGVFAGGSRLVGKDARPGIVDDYQKTLTTAHYLIADIFLGPHPDMFRMKDKLALVHDGWANPFIKAGEFHAYLDAAQKEFNAELVRQQQALSAEAAATTATTDAKK